jgi:phage terminase large subunit-like protein
MLSPVSRTERAISKSPAEILAKLPKAQRDAEIAKLAPHERMRLMHHWPFWARPEQIPPPGAWHTWLILAGRGAGKTRTGGEWIKANVCGSTPLAGGKYSRIALVAETAADARDVIVDGESGLLAIHHKDFRPLFEPSKRRLTWPNGAMATLYNATEPDQLRGPQHDAAWCDELAKWRYARETWDMLQFGLRLGTDPRQVITTTPRPIPLLRELLAREGKDVVVTRGSTLSNSSNLPPAFIAQIRARYEGTRLGRQELDGELLEDVPGALWTRAMLDATRLKRSDKLPDMERVVVAIDPATADPNKKGASDDTAETGIVVAGLGVDGRGYVLDDLSARIGPMGWARRALAGFDTYHADRIVAEINQGGAMVEATIRAERPSVPYLGVHASRGKVTRAEPIAALYEQGRVSHVGAFPALEDQMTQFTPFGLMGEGLKDRTDALVWALTELFPSMIMKARNEFEVEVSRPQAGAWAQPGGGWMGY